MAFVETIHTRIPTLWRNIRACFAIWRRNRRTRRSLADLPPALLKDVGITQRQALDEARRLF